MSKFSTLAGAPEGFDALLIAEAVRKQGGVHLHVARDEGRAAALAEALRFFEPSLPVLMFPAWDCLPYDRVSPKPEVAAERMATLAALAKPARGPRVVITTVSAALQRVPPRAAVAGASFRAKKGDTIRLNELLAFL